MKYSVCTGVIFFVFMLVCPVLADDEAVYTGEPHLSVRQGLHPTNPLSIAMSLRNFTLTSSYVFTNTSHKTETWNILLDVPIFHNWGAGNMYPDRSFSDLTMLVDNKLVTYERKSAAFLGDRDVTDTLKQYSLHPNDLGDIDRWTEHMTGAVSESFNELKAVGIMTESAIPKWSAKNVYSYNFEILSKASAQFTYTYKALPGMRYFFADSPQWLDELHLKGLHLKTLEEACGGSDNIKKYNILRWMILPLWQEEAQEKIEQLDLYFEMSPYSDVGPSVIILGLNGKTYSGRGALRLSLSNFRQQGNAWLVVFTPYQGRNYAPW